MKTTVRKSLLVAMVLAGCLQATAQTYTFTGIAQEQKEQNTPKGWPTVALPQLPAITSSNTLIITSYGAVADSTVDNTAAIQKALNAVPATGGMVVIPKGTWLFGTTALTIKQKTILHLSAGAKLKLQPYGTAPNNKTNFITNASNAGDIVIEGENKNSSILEGQGARWWLAREQKETFNPGAFVRFTSGARFLVRNIKFQNTPGVNLTIGRNGKGSDATVHDIIISEPSSRAGAGKASHNTDGIPTWCPRINIYRCNISSGDDNVVADEDTQYLHVWDCQFGDGHGASVGSYTTNVKHIIFEDIDFNGTDSGIRLKSTVGRGGGEEDFLYQNLTMKNVRYPFYIDSYYDKDYTTPENDKATAKALTATTPAFKNIYLKNIVITGATQNAIFLYGRPESHIKNVTLDNVQITAAKGISAQFVDNLRFINGTKVTATKGDLWLSKYDVTFGEADQPETAETALLDASTFTANKLATATFNNCAFTITNNGGKTFDKNTGSNYIKYSKGVVYTINIPDGIAVSAVTFSGNNHYTDSDASISEFNGQDVSADGYIFPASQEVKSYTLKLTPAANKSISFKLDGQQCNLSISITYSKSSTAGIKGIKASTNSNNAGIYDLAGHYLASNTSLHHPGIYIINGAKVLLR